LVNLKKDTVEHEFVNSALSRADRIRFAISDSGWSDRVPGAAGFRDILTELLRDWGTGLDLQLYEEGVTYFLGGQNRVLAEAEVFTSNYSLGHQRIHLAAPGVAFLLTALHEGESNFETHIHRFLSHTNLEAVLWANISLKRVRFTRITAQRTARTATEK